MIESTSRSSKAEFIRSILPQNWQEQFDANFSSNDLIDAYFKGRSDGENQFSKIILERFRENINKATKLAEQFIDLARERGVEIIHAHLKVQDIARFTILFIVSEEAFLSEDFRNIYLLSNFIKSTNNSDSFSINFTFTHQSEHLNSDCLSSDGFIMRYGNTGKA